MAFPDSKSADYKQDPLTGQKCLPSVVQIYNGVVEQEFYPWELCFGVRRPRTDLQVSGYGFAELEELVNVITSMLYSDEYNRRAFSQGSFPKGLIRIANNSGMNDESLKEFKRQWAMQMSGVYNSHKTPIVEADKLDFVNLSQSNKDMEYTQYQNYMIRVHCALFLIDSSEMGFNLNNGGGEGNTIFESNIDKRLKYSKDKGLSPLLKNSAKKINRHIIWRINPNYEFVFADEENQDDELANSIKELSNFKTIDEIRAEKDLKALGKEMGGDMILNGSYTSFYNNKMLSQQQNQSQGGQQEDEEDNDQEGFEDDDEQEQNYNPLQEDNEQTEKAIKDNKNPFVEDLNKFIKTLNKK